MSAIDGYLDAVSIKSVKDACSLRFDKNCKYKALETFIAYEQRMLPEDILLKLYLDFKLS